MLIVVDIDYASAQPRTRRPRPAWLRSWWWALPMTFVAWLSLGLMSWISQLDLCAILLPVFGFFLVGEFVIGYKQWTRCPGLITRIAMLGCVILGGVALRPPASDMYAEVFGPPPPLGVSQISYDVALGSVFDKPDIVLRFTVGPGAMASILKGPQFIRRSDLEKQHANGSISWDQFCKEALLDFNGAYASWRPSTRSTALEVYGVIDPADSDKEVETGIVYDPATGEVVVHQDGY